MSSVVDRTVFVPGDSRDLVRETGQALGRGFSRVIFLDASAPPGCRAGGARSDADGTVLRLDTNGRPLRDWDD